MQLVVVCEVVHKTRLFLRPPTPCSACLFGFSVLLPISAMINLDEFNANSCSLRDYPFRYSNTASWSVVAYFP